MYGNFFYYNDKIDEFSPAELAMIKFTFPGGISKHFHTYIRPGKCIFARFIIFIIFL